MQNQETPVLKHFSWVPVAYLTFVYNRDLILAVSKNEVTPAGLLSTLYAFNSSNWQTVKKFRDSDHPIPSPEVLVKVIQSIAAGDEDNLDFYSEFYWALKKDIKPGMDRIARREMLIKRFAGAEIKGKFGSLEALEAIKHQTVIRAAIEVIDEMFYRDGTYPRDKSTHRPRGKSTQNYNSKKSKAA